MMPDLAALAALHARLVLEAREAEAIAARNPDHAPHRPIRLMTRSRFEEAGDE
jgi:hypothetical protein